MDETSLHARTAPDDEPPRQVADRNIFFGRNGLRAGWGALLFTVIFFAAYFLLGWALHPLFRQVASGESSPTAAGISLGAGILTEVMLLACVAIGTVCLAKIEGRSFFSYGFQGEHCLARLVSGLFVGLLAITALVGVLVKNHLMTIEGPFLHHTEIWKYAGGWAIFFFLVAIFEESTLRGYLQFTLMRGIGFWWGAIALSALFGFSHHLNPGETPVGLFSAFAVGMVLALSLWYTGSLYWAVGFHAAWDWGESYFYGTSDSGVMVQGHLFASHPAGNPLLSGGATGPEGSLMVLVLLALVAGGMWIWWGRERAVSPFGK